ncbi:MAG: CDP-alcohol phosphatidyltransferase family protein [Raoultibacter sp.]
MKQIDRNTNDAAASEVVTDKIFTIPNVISIIRLCLVPIFLILLIDGHDSAAAFLFALAAGTDFLDGQIARRTNTVSKLGQLLDPAIDRILMIAGVGGLLMVGRLPFWIVAIVLIRDLLLLIGGSYLLKRYRIRIPVIYLGKVATTFLFVGFAGMLLNWPIIPGLGVCDLSWLPGFSAPMVSWGIWFVYVGLILSLVTTVFYLLEARKRLGQINEQDKNETV